MNVLSHTVITITLGSVLYSYTHSFAGFVWTLIAGIFIDIDHYIDYVRERGISLDLRKIYTECKHACKNFKKVTLILHSYELPLILWLAIFIFDLNVVWKCAAISLMLHIILDNAFNPMVPPAYFLWYRIANGFEAKSLGTNKKEVEYAH